MSANKGFITEKNFSNLQEELRKALINGHPGISLRNDNREYYYDSRYGWLRIPPSYQIHSSGSATGDQIANHTRSYFPCDIKTEIEGKSSS